ncbi:MAG: thioredoxin [Armatimonadetes bacterium]|nr:thioredoxin [Armatimonadota bacterium]NIM24676.1 thioredoxin [Armatimonadota bacterium]NIM68555.1 thioredoxin [Armatimonadota bacterium]NIM76935.1 thioredoxin [Armatimonadota bacterium]NIN06749.1 thioredoxin [Armatimonadota bacterium]
MGDIAAVTDKTFEKEVLQSSVPVLVDFWAPWCGPCRAMAPVLEAAAQQYEGKIKFAKLNVDDHPALASKYGISSIPALFLFKDGQIAESLIGFISEKDLHAKLQPHAG